jgi:hypothetical protein
MTANLDIVETPQQPAGPEHSTGQVPAPRTAPVGPGAPPPMFPVVPAGPPKRGLVPRSRRARLALAVIGGVLALLCVGGIGVTFVLYDDATKIDRSTPDQVVSSYLRAALVQRNDAQAQLFSCADLSKLSAIIELRKEIIQREQEFDVTVVVSWGALLRTRVSDSEETIRAELTISGSSNGRMQSRRNEVWIFRVMDESGWRVCGATKAT